MSMLVVMLIQKNSFRQINTIESMLWWSYMNNITFKMSIIIRYADQITIGDEVLIQENEQLTHGIVINVSSSTMQGKFVCCVGY